METTERKERSTLDRWGGGVPRFPRVKKKSHELFEIRGLLFQSVIFSYSNGRHRSMNRAWIARGFLSVIGRWSDSSGKRKYRDLLSLSRRKGENPDDQHGGRRGSRRGEKMARSGKGVGGSSNVPVFTASQNNRVKENARVNATREWDSQTQYCKTSHRSTARSSLANDGSSE